VARPTWQTNTRTLTQLDLKVGAKFRQQGGEFKVVRTDPIVYVKVLKPLDHENACKRGTESAWDMYARPSHVWASAPEPVVPPEPEPEWSHLEMRCDLCGGRFNIALHSTEAGRQLINAEHRLAELEQRVVAALGGYAMARKTADLDDLPPGAGWDGLRELARFVAGTAIA
jgi:hypothetical protein